MARGVRARSGVADAKAMAREAADSEPIGWLARAGLAARGTVYVLIGALAFAVARGASGKNADQKGALQEVLSHAYGGLLVGLLAVGFLGYALWRLSEAAFGVTGEGRQPSARIKSLARGLAYLALTFTAVAALRGSSQSQSGQQESLTAQVMKHSGGRLLVALVGVAIVVAGAAMIVEGVRLTFMRYFTSVPPQIRRLVVHLGRVGTVGRGLVFALIGALVVSAAWTFDPKQAGGMDQAFRTLLQQPFGQLLGIVTALALVAFGIYGLAESRYRRV